MNPVDGQRRDVLRGLGRAALPGAGGGESRIVVAVTVTGGRLCRATDQTYRLDTPQTRSFLGNYVTLPWLLP